MSLTRFFDGLWAQRHVHGLVLLIDVLFVLIVYHMSLLLGTVLGLPVWARSAALSALCVGLLVIYSVLRLLVLRWFGVRVSWRALVGRLFLVMVAALMLLSVVVQVFFALRNLVDGLTWVFLINVFVFVLAACVLFFVYVLFQRAHKKRLVRLVMDLFDGRTYRVFWAPVLVVIVLSAALALVHVLIKAFVPAMIAFFNTFLIALVVLVLYVLHAYVRWGFVKGVFRS